MLTRCPHCQTAFRVTTEQLKVRQGKVRCGACQSIFDALDSLTDELAVVPGPEAVAAPPPAITPPPGLESRLPQDGEEAVAAPETAPMPELPSEPEPEPEPESEREPETKPDPEPAQESPLPAEAVEAEAPLPEEWAFTEPPPPRRWPWALGALLLFVLGAGQLLYTFRVELAVVAPELRPTLEAGCALLDCTVPRPRKPELAGIESSDLVPAGADRLLLTATLKNRAPFAQEYPHLELTLTDTRDEALLRKVLAPADWLPAGQDAAAGFPARGEVAVRLLLEAPGVPAVGYRLYLFYP